MNMRTRGIIPGAWRLNFLRKPTNSTVGMRTKNRKAAERLVVIHDDLDLPLGTMKLSFDRGSGGHKGLESVMRAFKTKKFARVRIGVSPSTATGKLKKPSGEKEILDFILEKFRSSEMDELKQVFKRMSEALETIVLEGPQMAMNRFNPDAKSGPRP